MTYYHGSPTGGLTLLQPSVTKFFGKPKQVCMTTLLPMALFYLVRNFEYAYGYTKAGQIFYEEYFPDALREIYGGKSGWLYICAPEEAVRTEIPNEAVSAKPVPVTSAVFVPDAYEALLEQERAGALCISRYETLSAESLQWIRQAEAEEIRSRRLWEQESPMAAYMRRHYPESWALACGETDG